MASTPTTDEPTQRPFVEPAIPLDDLPTLRRARVLSVCGDGVAPDWPRLLADIGFTPGETVQVLRRAAIGGDPLVVRVGTATFALRRAEAACVRVRLIDEGRTA